LETKSQLSRRVIYKVVFRRPDRVHFSQYLPYLTVLVNGIYWEPGHPKLATRGELRKLWAQPELPRLKVLADLSCDIDGSIEATVHSTTSKDAVYVYDPETGETTPGVRGRGPVVLAVANLPAEFPRDASEHFGDGLFPFVPGLVAAEFTVSFEHLSLPAAVLEAVITHGGELTPRYRYLQEFLGRAAS
jgi:alpha-aminoadipic semialdehyde synthase